MAVFMKYCDDHDLLFETTGMEIQIWNTWMLKITRQPKCGVPSQGANVDQDIWTHDPKIDRVSLFIINNLHMKFESDYAKNCRPHRAHKVSLAESQNQ